MNGDDPQQLGTVLLERINEQKIRAAFPVTNKRKVCGYGATVPAALGALARSFERLANEQLETLLAAAREAAEQTDN